MPGPHHPQEFEREAASYPLATGAPPASRKVEWETQRSRKVDTSVLAGNFTYVLYIRSSSHAFGFIAEPTTDSTMMLTAKVSSRSAFVVLRVADSSSS